jgi:hypothetical protein
MPSEPKDLSDYTTEEMLAIIGKRYDSFVFVGSQSKNKSAQDLTYCSVGPFHSCLGLVETAKLLVTAGGFEE